MKRTTCRFTRSVNLMIFNCLKSGQLNQKTVPDRHPLPRIQATLESHGGNNWFSMLDQGKAYHQLRLYNFSDSWKIVCTLHDLRDKICIPYLDDVIVFSKSCEEHVDHVRQVLQRLRTNGIKLKPEKCKLFQREVNYLGQIVSSEGYNRLAPRKLTL
jgi:hypothetical protein